MDRRIEDKGFDARPHSFYVAINHLGHIIPQPKRSGQDRRKYDLLAEARKHIEDRLYADPIDEGARRAIEVLITMMERRK